LIQEHLLTGITALPLLGVSLLALIGAKHVKAHAWIGMMFSFAVLGAAAFVYAQIPVGVSGFIYEVKLPWIAPLGASFSLGVDGMSAIFVLLTALLHCLALGSRLISHPDTSTKSFVIAMLALESAMLGTFLARDLFLFFVFFEATLMPMYYLIGVYGGKNKTYATLKFFIYTMAGSIFMFLAILALHGFSTAQLGQADLSLDQLSKISIPAHWQAALLSMFTLAFAVKIPVFPLHTWLPDAHVEAPTAGSVILAGILLKLGGYGLVRVAFPLFPQGIALVAPVLGILGVIGIIYGAYAAWGQADMKKLVAYSSVSHMGFVVLGLASGVPLAVSGAVFQMVAHALSTGALFLLIGMIYERRHTRLMADYGGLVKVMPIYTTLFVITTMASIGLPGLCGFVGEFMILTGSFKSTLLPKAPYLVGLSVLGIVFGAAYMLMMVERVFWGKLRHTENMGLKDIGVREIASVLPLIILAFVLGVYPKPILERIHQSLQPQSELVHVAP